MANLIKRLKKRAKMTADNWRSDCHFSKKLAWLRLTADLSGRAGVGKISKWANSKRQEWILEYLADSIAPVVEKYRDKTDKGVYSDNAPIWVCWWTGEEDAPLLVKRCLSSIRKNAGEHPVYLITRENYMQWIEIPGDILSKVNSGKICIANFTDYLRATLIKDHGGLWIDSTIFLSDHIPEAFFRNPFYTCKNNTEADDCGYISRYRWTSFCISGWKNNVLFSFFSDALGQYWKNHEVSVDYLLVDFILETGYRQIPEIRKQIDSVPGNNIHRDDLQAAFNAALPASEFWKVVQKDTSVYKLSWREAYREEVEGQQTVYGYFLSMDM